MQTCVDVIQTLAPCLTAGGLDAGLAEFISILIGVTLVGLFPLVLVIILIWLERKIAARVQDRFGPNRVGPFGLFQNLADAVKLIIKEDITPAGADRLIYNLAPIVAVLSTILIWAAIPFSPLHIGANLGIGLLYIVAVSSIGTLSVMMAGWASNNKYALLGSFRVVAQLVSYEIPLVLALLVPVLLTGSMGMQDLVRATNRHVVHRAGAGFGGDLLHLEPGGNRPRTLRHDRSGIGTGRWLQHRILRHEVRLVHGERVHARFYGEPAVFGDFPGRLVWPA